MERFKPTLNITGTSVEFDYTVSLADGFGRFYDYLKQKDASKVTQTKEEYIKINLLNYQSIYRMALRTCPIQLMNLIEVMLKFILF